VNAEESITQILRWRLARAEAEAPPAPRAAHLLEMARPWWEAWPQRFAVLVDRLTQMQVVAFGHAMSEPPRRGRAGHPVPALIVRAGDEAEASARVLYLGVRDGRFHLRFRLDAAPEPAERTFEVTFVAPAAAQPLFAADAALSVDSEYRIDAKLPEEFAADWGRLRVTDRMPFRLILRPGSNGGVTDGD
jgi:hypothetical protein